MCTSRLLAFAAVTFLLGRPSESFASDTLSRVKETGAFTFGGDQEGGGPYMFPDPEKPDALIGFEVDLANAIAEVLSKQLGTPIRATFSQGQWDMLPGLLRTGRIDVVLNGYELTAARAEAMDPTAPYYIYQLQTLARVSDASLGSLADFSPAKPRRVGVLGGSAAEAFVRDRFKNGEAEVVLYDGNTNAMMEVVSEKLDATVQDNVIAIFYAKEFPSLRPVGAPQGRGEYVMYTRKGDDAWRQALDAALAELSSSGRLRTVYERYGIWNETQNELGKPSANARAASAGPKEGFFTRHGKDLLHAAGMTILLAVTAMPLAILIGLLIALGRLYGPRPLATVLTAYVEVIRGTPLLLQLLVIFYLLPALGLTLHPIVAGVLGLAINYSAYEAEIYRAGLLAVPKGQMEAALTLGMSRRTALRRVILPQAMRLVVPPVTNDFIALFKDTSVCSVITVVELSKRYNIAVMNNPGEILPLAATAGLLYLLMSYPLSMLSRRLETGVLA